MTMGRGDWLVLGIAGVTCGGKTTLANRLLKTFHHSLVFHQDRYFLPDDDPRHTPCPGIPHHNYDILSALDMEKMHSDILATMSGDDRACDRNSSRNQDTMEIPGKRLLIVEGFTALNDTNIFQLCDFKYYIVLEREECELRRVHRVYDPPDVPGYFETCVWPEHEKYRAEMERESSVCFLSGADPDIFQKVMADLQKAGAVLASDK